MGVLLAWKYPRKHFKSNKCPQLILFAVCICSKQIMHLSLAACISSGVASGKASALLMSFLDCIKLDKLVCICITYSIVWSRKWIMFSWLILAIT